MGEVGSPVEMEGRPGLDSTGGLGTYVGVPGLGPPGVEQDWRVMVSVTVVYMTSVVVMVTYGTPGEELGPPERVE
jgi:hypothetical protein